MAALPQGVLLDPAADLVDGFHPQDGDVKASSTWVAAGQLGDIMEDNIVDVLTLLHASELDLVGVGSDVDGDSS